jgi:hypothetical protein
MDVSKLTVEERNVLKNLLVLVKNLILFYIEEISNQLNMLAISKIPVGAEFNTYNNYMINDRIDNINRSVNLLQKDPVETAKDSGTLKLGVNINTYNREYKNAKDFYNKWLVYIEDIQSKYNYKIEKLQENLKFVEDILAKL